MAKLRGLGILLLYFGACVPTEAKPGDGGSAGAATETGGGGDNAAGGSGGSNPGDCVPGDTDSCYDGPLGTAGIGICATGARTCTGARVWGPCLGQITPLAETCKTELDEDCDGATPPCACAPGEEQSCYSGPTGTADVGVCATGARTCDIDGSWSSCIGEVLPATEDCNGSAADEDCDGEVNEDGASCVCVPGSSASCYTGPSGTLGVGQCVAGIAICDVAGLTYQNCAGEVLPGTETCFTSIDDDCDGSTNEDGPGCGCDIGFDDCDGNPGNGCDSLRTSTHCGACANACTETEVCSGAGCVSAQVLQGSYTITNQIDANLLAGYTRITGNLIIDAPGMLTLELPNLVEVDGSVQSAQASTPATITTINLPLLTHTGGIKLGMQALTTLLLPSLLQLDGGLDLRNSIGLTAVELPKLTATGEAVRIDAVGLSLSLPAFRTGHLILTGLASLAVPVWQMGDLSLSNIVNLPTASFPALYRSSIILTNVHSGGPLTLPSLVEASLPYGVRISSCTFDGVELPSLVKTNYINIWGSTVGDFSAPILAAINRFEWDQGLRFINSNVSSIDLRSVTYINDPKIENNAGLDFIDLRSLVHTDGSFFHVLNNTGLKTLNLHAYSTGPTIWFRIEDNPSLRLLDLTSLSTIRWLTISNNDALEMVELPALVEATDGLGVFDNASLKLITAPLLTEEPTAQFAVIGAPALEQCIGPLIFQICPSSHFQGDYVVTSANDVANLSKYFKIDGDLVFNTSLTSFEADTLGVITGTIRPIGPGCAGGSTLASISFPSLTQVGGVDLADCAPLASLSLPDVSLVGDVDLTGTGIAQLDVNSLKQASNVTLSSMPNLSALFMHLEQVSGAFVVNDNGALTSIGLPNLTTIASSMTISNNSSLDSLKFPLLSTLGSMSATGNPVLAECELAPLRRTFGEGKVISSGNDTLGTCTHYSGSFTVTSQADFDFLDDYTSVSGNIGLVAPGIADFYLPLLTTLGGYISVNCGQASSLETVYLPALVSMGALLMPYSCQALREVNMPVVTTMGSIDLYKSGIQTLALDSLQQIDGSVDLAETQLISLSLPSLEQIAWTSYISNCPALTSIDLPALQTVGNFLSITVNPILQSVFLPLIVNTSLQIQSNPMLPECSVAPLGTHTGIELLSSGNDEIATCP